MEVEKLRTLAPVKKHCFDWLFLLLSKRKPFMSLFYLYISGQSHFNTLSGGGSTGISSRGVLKGFMKRESLQ